MNWSARLNQADWRLNVSVALALEYEDVLKRTNMLRDISKKAIDDFLDYLFSISNLAPFVLRQRPRLRDPDDERILRSGGSVERADRHPQ